MTQFDMQYNDLGQEILANGHDTTREGALIVTSRFKIQ